MNASRTHSTRMIEHTAPNNNIYRSIAAIPVSSVQRTCGRTSVFIRFGESIKRARCATSRTHARTYAQFESVKRDKRPKGGRGGVGCSCYFSSLNSAEFLFSDPVVFSGSTSFAHLPIDSDGIRRYFYSTSTRIVFCTIRLNSVPRRWTSLCLHERRVYCDDDFVL